MLPCPRTTGQGMGEPKPADERRDASLIDTLLRTEGRRTQRAGTPSPVGAGFGKC